MSTSAIRFSRPVQYIFFGFRLTAVDAANAATIIFAARCSAVRFIKSRIVLCERYADKRRRTFLEQFVGEIKVHKIAAADPAFIIRRKLAQGTQANLS